MGDRIVVMAGGKIMQVGTPREVYHESANVFVATFLGSPGMNLIEKGEFLFGFRPEQFLPKEAITNGAKVQPFKFKVNRVEYLGADQLAYGSLQGISGGTRIVAKLGSEIDVKISAETTYDFVVQKNQLRFFDKKSQVRIEPRLIE
jgi:multiple sugar transport system ATP-binding protein